MGKTKIQWVDIGDGYRVSNKGDVLGPSGKILKPIEAHRGHLYIFVRGKKRYIHQLVLEGFVGKRENGLETRHLDGNPANNQLSNLVWGTRQENQFDRLRHGTLIPHHSQFTKLTPTDILLFETCTI